MSIATYRGVRYDTDARKSAPTEKHVVAETYRGTKHTEVVEVRKWNPHSSPGSLPNCVLTPASPNSINQTNRPESSDGIGEGNLPFFVLS